MKIYSIQFKLIEYNLKSTDRVSLRVSPVDIIYKYIFISLWLLVTD